MLVAKNSRGDVLSLTNTWSRNDLILLRQKGEDFYCPSCKQHVQLKIGEERIPHFAHIKNKACNSFSEGESIYHLKGKLQLFDWLRSKNLSPVLEPYNPTLKQRPDLSVQINNKLYMIEYQCSSIEKEIFQSRNHNYLRNGYKPFWILGGKRLKRTGQKQFTFSSIDWQFVTLIHQKPTLLFYCSEMEKFLFVYNIIPLTASSVYANLKCISKNNFSITHNIIEDVNNKPFDLEWTRMKKNWRLTNTKYPTTIQKRLLYYLYNQHISPSLLPSEVGLPVPSMFWIVTPALIWQAWLLIGYIDKLEVNQSFLFRDIYDYFKRKKREEGFVIRNLPFVKNSHYSFAIMEYLNRLVSVGILANGNNTTFTKKKALVYPKGIEQAIESDTRIMILLRNKNKGL